ncbi:hypothetical protein RB653_006859 [Dictyostelium firmibasis]|uniref:Potassium channel domain-containing protein n=1 Tax=Dictyostelium firmibasis TaxID=79012 RepID=A0AAN7TVB3_9MYCE
MSRRKALINLQRLKDSESELPILEKSLSNIDKYSEIRSENTDRVLRHRYVLIMINGMIGVALMCTELQLSWSVEQHSLEINKSTKILRSIIFILNLILCIQLVDYYLLLLSEVTHDWLTKRARGFRVTRINVLKSTKLGPLFWCEILVCSLQPLPFVSGEYAWYKDSKWGLLMWLRLYLFCRILRDFSPVYKLRFHIQKQLLRDIAPKFNWTLSLKYIISIAPILTYLTFTLVTLAVTGQWMYVFEREKNELFSFAVSVYISFLSMITGWPTDTYDEYNPQTFGGRSAAIVACIFGLLLLSFVIESFARLTQATSHQRPILNLVSLVEAQKKERESAARLIQLVWRRWRWQSSTNMSQNRSMFNSKEALFCVKYIEYAKTLSRMRRERRAIQSQCQESEPQPSIIEEIKTTLSNCEATKSDDLTSSKTIETLQLKIKSLEDNQTIMLAQLNQLIQMQQFQIQIQQNQHQQQQVHLQQQHPQAQSSPQQQPQVHIFNNENQFI